MPSHDRGLPPDTPHRFLTLMPSEDRRNDVAALLVPITLVHVRAIVAAINAVTAFAAAQAAHGYTVKDVHLTLPIDAWSVYLSEAFLGAEDVWADRIRGTEPPEFRPFAGDVGRYVAELRTCGAVAEMLPAALNAEADAWIDAEDVAMETTLLRVRGDGWLAEASAHIHPAHAFAILAQLTDDPAERSAALPRAIEEAGVAYRLLEEIEAAPEGWTPEHLSLFAAHSVAEVRQRALLATGAIHSSTSPSVRPSPRDRGGDDRARSGVGSRR